MGVAILTLVLFQACLGAIVHWVKLPRRDDSGRSFKHYFHIFLGLVIAILGFSQPATGMWQEMPRWYYPTPGWNWRAGWIVVVCVSHPSCCVALTAGMGHCLCFHLDCLFSASRAPAWKSHRQPG